MKSEIARKKLIKAIPLFVFLAGMLTILLHAGSSGLFETSEGRYASVARQMIDSNDWFTPRHNGLKHFTKPPVTYWITACGIKFFGTNEFGARFFLSFAAGFTALGTYLIGKLLFGKSQGLLAAIIMISSLFFQIQFRGLTTDPYLTMFETFMVLSFFSFVRKKRRHWEIAFWVCASMAMMTKGPPGLIPLAGLIPAALLTGHRSEIRQLFTSLSGWIVFFILGTGWYLLIAATNPGLISYFVLDETVRRVASNDHQRSAPFVYYFVLLPIGLFPWTGFLLAGIKNAWRNFRMDVNLTFVFLWLCVPLIIFTLSRSKLAGYALPLIVPCSLLAAHTLINIAKELSSARPQRWNRQANSIALITLVAGLGIISWGISNHSELQKMAGLAFYAGSYWFFAGTCLLVFQFLRKRQSTFFVITMIVPGLMFFALSGIAGNEKIGKNKYLSSPWMLLKRISTLPPTQSIICIDKMLEGWYFYTGRNIKTWNVNRITKFDKERADELVLAGDEALLKHVSSDTLLVLREKDVQSIENILQKSLKTITQEGNWIVAFPEEKINKND